MVRTCSVTGLERGYYDCSERCAVHSCWSVLFRPRDQRVCRGIWHMLAHRQWLDATYAQNTTAVQRDGQTSSGKVSYRIFLLVLVSRYTKQTMLVVFHDQARTCLSQPFQLSQPKLFLWLNNGQWNQPPVAISGWSVLGVQRVGFLPAAQHEWAVRPHPLHRRRAPLAMACRPLWRSASKRLSSVFRSRERIFHSCVEWFIKSIERCITLDTCTLGYDPAFVICFFSCLLRASGGIAVKSQQHNSGVF